ncbi:MAG: hypothetical protein ABR991_02530 [Terracidiphilus sp.]|jgi:hypothetical protein
MALADPFNPGRRVDLLNAGKALGKLAEAAHWQSDAATIYNGSMRLRSLFRLSIRVAVLGLVVSLLAAGLTASAQQNADKRGRKFKMPPPTARVEITVVRDSSGKPIENAAVIFHPIENGRDSGTMELKTNEDGKTIIDILPLGGTVRMQIIAKGFQTYGDDYKIDQDQIAIEIRMKRPGEQYSIYKPHPEASEGGKDSTAPKPFSERKMYSVNLSVGSTKPWILIFSLPQHEVSTNAENTGQIEAPFPTDIIRPNFAPDTIGANGIIVHGFVNLDGSFENLTITSPPDFSQAKSLLDSLAKWKLRPATQNGQNVRVEVLLTIPGDTK